MVSITIGCVFSPVFSSFRLQPICSIESRLPPPEHEQIPLRTLQFKRGLLHELRKGNATKEQIRLHNLLQQLPQAIIIGVRKGGTRALLEMLNLHPAVVKASQEIHFFDNDQNYARGIDWYREKMPFSFPHQITIEKSPAYFITEEVPERIFKMNSSIKLLVIVREPTVRAVSDYTQVLEGKERKNKTYHKFEKLAVDSGTCEVNTKYKAVRTSIYTKHLERWLKYFPVDQFHIVDGDRLIADPLPELQLVERFLNLPSRISQYNLYFNATRGFYCLRFNIVFNKCLAGSKGRTHPEVDPSVVTKLQKFFHPFNQKFFQMTGRAFNWPWGPSVNFSEFIYLIIDFLPRYTISKDQKSTLIDFEIKIKVWHKCDPTQQSSPDLQLPKEMIYHIVLYVATHRQKSWQDEPEKSPLMVT